MKSLIQKHIVKPGQSGAIVAEFLIVFPAFLVVCLFVIELSLWYVDKHFLRLATYEAARSFVTTDFPSSAPSGPCKEVLDNGISHLFNSASETAYSKARRRAAVKMAAVSPSADQIFRAIGMEGAANTLSSISETNLSANAVGGFMKAFRHLAMRLPAAYAMTYISNCYYDARDRSVTVSVTYLRRAKMPIVDRTIWLVFLITRFNTTMQAVGLNGMMQLRLDDYYTNVVPYSPSIESAQVQLNGWRQQLRELVSGVTSMGLDLSAGNAILNGNPLMASVGDVLTSASAELTSQVNQIDAAAAQAIDNLQGMQDVINGQGRFLTGVAMSVPSVLRVVPMTDTIRLVKPATDNPDGRWRDGNAKFITKFFDRGSYEGTGWSDWTKGMQTNHGTVRANP